VQLAQDTLSAVELEQPHLPVSQGQYCVQCSATSFMVFASFFMIVPPYLRCLKYAADADSASARGCNL